MVLNGKNEQKIFYCRHDDWKIRSLAIRAAITWFVAVVVWLNDKFLCEAFWINFPYLHAIWHLYIAVAGMLACVIFSYFHVDEEFPRYKAVLR